jgi:phospholipid/cholesterol/gamma-HCH transport system substrate-binding protein
MIGAEQIDRDVAGRHVLVRRGVVGAVFFLLLAAALTAVGKGQFSNEVHISALVDNAGGSLVPGSDVKSRGVILGRVDSIELAGGGDGRGARIHMTLEGDQAVRIPASTTARVLPAAVFGTAFVDLIPGPGGAPLRDGSVVVQATDGKTLELQDALDNTDRVLSAIDPAELASTLAAVGNALDGRGEQIGETVEATDSYLAKLEPQMPLVRDVLGRSATVLRILDDVAPAVLDGIDDSEGVMETIRHKRRAINKTLVRSDDLVQTGDSFLQAQRAQLERVIHRLAFVLDALYDFRTGFPTGFKAFSDFAGIAGEGLTKGPWLDTDVFIKINGKEQYTAADCPRYGSGESTARGDNCGAD